MPPPRRVGDDDRGEELPDARRRDRHRRAQGGRARLRGGALERGPRLRCARGVGHPRQAAPDRRRGAALPLERAARLLARGAVRRDRHRRGGKRRSGPAFSRGVRREGESPLIYPTASNYPLAGRSVIIVMEVEEEGMSS